MISIKYTHTIESDRSVPAPERKSEGSIGWDIRANLPTSIRATGLIIPPNKIQIVPTGIALEIPVGYECQVRSRSGLAKDSAVFVLNSPGTIDCDFRGELSVLLANFGQTDFKIKHADRIAQLVFSMVPQIQLVRSEALSKTGRSDSGFGSTGLN